MVDAEIIDPFAPGAVYKNTGNGRSYTIPNVSYKISSVSAKLPVPDASIAKAKTLGFINPS